MKLNTLNSTLYEASWYATTEHQGHVVYARNEAIFVAPTGTDDTFPEGTTNAVLAYLHSRSPLPACPTTLAYHNDIPVVFEKNGTALWARIELPGLFLVTCGCSTDCILDRLRSILTHMVVGNQAQSETVSFRPVYDTSAVWELIQELKSIRIAEQTGIDAQQLSQIMTGTAYACPEQTKRLETSLRKLGRQLMQMSIQ